MALCATITAHMYREVSHCRICGNSKLEPILDLGMQALTGIFPKAADQCVPAAPLQLVKCSEAVGQDPCGLVQLKHSVQGEAMYGANYGYRSGLNRSMVDHLEEKARAVRSVRPLVAGDVVLDIGSNDGTLLRAFDAPGIELLGMDPTGEKFRDWYPPHIQLVSDFFSAAAFHKIYGSRKAAVVTSIAMFYDLECPLEFMRQVAEVLGPDGIWVFEQSYMPVMLAKTSYDTICHEHLEYYRLKQIQWMCQRAGLKIVDVEFNHSNGGSFSVTAAKESAPFRANEARVNSVLREEENGGHSGRAVYEEFSQHVFRHRDRLCGFLDQAERDGERIIGYGASTKGNVILQLCDITSRQLPFIAEVNPDKFGAFTPGTRIPIISEAEARAMRPDGFMVLPWHFRDTIVSREHTYLSEGGKLIFPLPDIDVVRGTPSFQATSARN